MDKVYIMRIGLEILGVYATLNGAKMVAKDLTSDFPPISWVPGDDPSRPGYMLDDEGSEICSITMWRIHR